MGSIGVYELLIIFIIVMFLVFLGILAVRLFRR
jgi:hypothetical protein